MPERKKKYLTHLFVSAFIHIGISYLLWNISQSLHYRYYLPTNIQKDVDYITPGVKAGVFKKRDVQKSWTTDLKGHSQQWKPKAPMMPHMPPNHGSDSLANCSAWITTACVEAFYHVFPNRVKVSTANSIGVFEELDTYSQEDLNLYFENYAPSIPQGTHPILAAVDGAVAPVPQADAGGESMLDLSILYSLIYPQTVTLYQTNDLGYANDRL